MLEIFVCDDDANITDFLEFFILKHFKGFCRVVSLNGCQELIGMIEFYERVPDILIMDINLRDGNGIEVVKTIQANYPMVKVIYLTGVIGYATSIFETSPSYFLTKPIMEDKLSAALNKVIGAVEQDKNNTVVIRTNGSEAIVYRHDIKFVESRGRKLFIHMSDGKQIEIYEKMDVMQEILGLGFVRSHKSFLINMKYIIERTNNRFLLSDGNALPISKNNLKYAKMQFISYLGEA